MAALIFWRANRTMTKVTATRSPIPRTCGIVYDEQAGSGKWHKSRARLSSLAQLRVEFCADNGQLRKTTTKEIVLFPSRVVSSSPN
jgi:hypothetical protein